MSVSLPTQIEALESRSPQHYGTLRRHLPLLRTALDDATRPYPTSRQLYDQLEDPPIPPHTFGRLLALLVDFGIIALYTERSSANRYDIRAYDAADLEELAALLA
ncbi:hypothetical protein SAMN04487948_1303 [Halogranum amylolyticum]|uniref:Uncharacterized protein n=1 Tax=Halogranum amylolyticum TaxID=660520 RepID=A0A1H8WH52_9EURY|nr:hypothetical protein [Halogranum amylolyticum]SEP26995.1 hypothetical protein SAMN04487948_1303 [Halogranum amylolyticum]